MTGFNYALYNVSRNCWLEYFNEEEETAIYQNKPVMMFRDTGADVAKFAKTVANATGDEFSIHQLLPGGLTYLPSLNSQMAVHTKIFAPKVAEFIHNTAIRFGDSREEKLAIAKDLSESLNKAMSESIDDMIKALRR